MPDSTAYSKMSNPQSWNLYAYSFNNPLWYIDPTGNEVHRTAIGSSAHRAGGRDVAAAHRDADGFGDSGGDRLTSGGRSERIHGTQRNSRARLGEFPHREERLDASGRSAFAHWFEGLNATAAARVTVALTRLGQGNFSNVEGVGSGVYERKIDFGPGYRIYFGKDGERIVILLGGSSKKRQGAAIRGCAVGVGRVQAPQGRKGVIEWH